MNSAFFDKYKLREIQIKDHKICLINSLWSSRFLLRFAGDSNGTFNIDMLDKNLYISEKDSYDKTIKEDVLEDIVHLMYNLEEFKPAKYLSIIDGKFKSGEIIIADTMTFEVLAIAKR